jgi:hypothetical protein
MKQRKPARQHEFLDVARGPSNFVHNPLLPSSPIGLADLLRYRVRDHNVRKIKKVVGAVL